MLRILGRADSGNVQKVLWCCAELGLEYERDDVGGKFGGTDTPQYRALNPNGLVPTIVDGDVVLWESNTIVRYLADRYGDGTLCPMDPGRRGAAERWMDWQLSTLAPAIGPIFMGLIRTPPEKRNLDAIAAARNAAGRALSILDGCLAEQPYVAGPALTIGDIPVGMMTYRWYAMDIERENLPNLKRWYDALRERPGYKLHVMQPLV